MTLFVQAVEPSALGLGDITPLQHHVFSGVPWAASVIRRKAVIESETESVVRGRY
jgi:hypothetical protein